MAEALTVERVLAEDARQREQQWAALVERVASGEVHKDLADGLRRLGRTPEELRDAVAALRRRRELLALVGRQPELERRLTELERNVKEAAESFEEVRRQHQERVMPLLCEIEEVRVAPCAAERARGELRGGIGIFGLPERLVEARQRHIEAQRRLAAARRDASDARSWLKTAHECKQRGEIGATAKVEIAEARLRRAEDALQRVERDAVAAGERLAALEAEALAG